MIRIAKLRKYRDVYRFLKNKYRYTPTFAKLLKTKYMIAKVILQVAHLPTNGRITPDNVSTTITVSLTLDSSFNTCVIVLCVKTADAIYIEQVYPRIHTVIHGVMSRSWGVLLPRYRHLVISAELSNTQSVKLT